MSIVGLDIATESGCAALYEGGAAPELSTIHCGGIAGEVGPAMERLRVALLAIHQREPITHIFKEQTILPHARRNQRTGKMAFGTNQATVYKLNALAGMAEWFGLKVGAVVRDVAHEDWRRHFIGKIGGMKSLELKQAAIRMARMHGWTPANFDEADAAGVLDYGMACFRIRPPWRDLPLMGGAAVLRDQT